MIVPAPRSGELLEAEAQPAGHTDRWLKNLSPYSWMGKLDNSFRNFQKKESHTFFVQQKVCILLDWLIKSSVGMENWNVANPEPNSLGVCWPLSSYLLPTVLSSDYI